MEIGDYITSSLYSEKGKGRIIAIDLIGSDTVFDVYFDKTKEVLSLNDENIEKVKDVMDKFNEHFYDNPALFPIRVLSERIDSFIYQNKIISACNFGIIPLPHQVLTVNNVLESQFKPRCLIADEVGLGKTIEAALIYEELKLRKMVKRILIVAPSGLTTQWKDELKTKFNEDFVLINKNTFKGLKEIHGEEKVWESHDKVITSVDFLKPKPYNDDLSERVLKRREWHNEFVTDKCVMSNWDMVIFDEAHNLSKSSDGLETARYKLGKRLADVTPILLLLTATPHQGDTGKFRNLLKLIDQYKFYSSDSLTSENVSSVTVKNNKRAAVDFKGNLIFKKRFPVIVKIPKIENDIESQLYDAVTDYVSKYYDLAFREGNFPVMFLLTIYQRMVSSSSRAIFKSLSKRLYYLKKDLSSAYHFSRINRDEFKELNAQEAFNQLDSMQTKGPNRSGNFHIKPYMEDEIDILEGCVNLARKASHGRQDFKMRKLLEIVDNVIDDEGDFNTKFIIFTEFLETQNYIYEVLESMGYSVTLFNGSMSLEDKIESKNRFKNECQFLITTDSGGEGINLQFCHVMINYDLPWNPMKIEQRIGRIDRIGQTKDVKVFNFVLEDTVEERVRSVLDSKLDLIAQEFGDDKRNDVLTALSDENNFDDIYIEAIRAGHIEEKQLQKIASSIYMQAKSILENQDFLVPFTPVENNSQIKNYIVGNDSSLIKNLIDIYTKFKGVELKEYSTKEDVYYFDGSIDGYRYKNIVFNRDLAIENEKFVYMNFNHPFVKRIINESMSTDTFSFNLDYNGYQYDVSGILFYYRFELTNNEGFVKRKLVPIFLDDNGNYDVNVSKWFKNIYDFNFKQANNNYDVDLANLISIAEEIRDEEMDKFKSRTELELIDKLDKDKEKFDKYFEDKEFAINKIAIDNIKNKQLNDLNELRDSEMQKVSRRKNLVPKIELFAIAKVNLKRDYNKLI